MTEATHIVLTPQQYSEGWYEKRGCIAYHRSWRPYVVRHDEHGNVICRAPEGLCPAGSFEVVNDQA